MSEDSPSSETIDVASGKSPDLAPTERRQRERIDSPLTHDVTEEHIEKDSWSRNKVIAL